MRILVVVDMQNDFIDGALGTPEAQAIVPNVIKKIKKYRDNEDTAIIYTADTHGKDYLDTQEGRKLPVPHCIYPSDGWMIPESVYTTSAPIVMKKTFGADNLSDYIKAMEKQPKFTLESIEVIGLCTDICVISNVMILKAFFPEVPIVVDSSCCAGVTPESHKNALEAMKMCQIEVV